MLLPHPQKNKMSGFDCELTEEPPASLQYDCPICLLIHCEPYKVSCCGKSFCRKCIQRIKASKQPCPTCKDDKFESFPNEALEQSLCGLRVFCSNKGSGCDWQGELGHLDQHLNSDPQQDQLLVGCAYISVKCLYCNKPHPRGEIEQHQASECMQRPFTCTMCEQYKSTYDDVTNNHALVCEHWLVECEFSGTGCDAMVHRKDLPSHLCVCEYALVECEFSGTGCDAMVHRKISPLTCVCVSMHLWSVSLVIKAAMLRYAGKTLTLT